MTSQQIKDLFLAIDLLISERIKNTNDTFEQFNDRRIRITSHALLSMKIKDDKGDDNYE